MSISRRQFLKIAGASALLGLGSFTSIELLEKVEASQFKKTPKAIRGKRWGMAVDVKKFQTEEDYKRVIEACHRIHNVPDLENPKHEIKWIWTDTYEHTFPGQESPYLLESLEHKPLIVLCNHCNNPPCVRVCPTKATFKREEDGIVMMDMHRCIGCRFCMAGCPFGARSFNWRDPRPFINEKNSLPYDSTFAGESIKKGVLMFPTRMRGVVEKCTFCYERLAVGLMPACVEASQGSLIFGDLNDSHSEIRETLSTHFTIRRKPELGTEPSVYYII